MLTLKASYSINSCFKNNYPFFGPNFLFVLPLKIPHLTIISIMSLLVVNSHLRGSHRFRQMFSCEFIEEEKKDQTSSVFKTGSSGLNTSSLNCFSVTSVSVLTLLGSKRVCGEWCFDTCRCRVDRKRKPLSQLLHKKLGCSIACSFILLLDLNILGHW